MMILFAFVYLLFFGVIHELFFGETFCYYNLSFGKLKENGCSGFLSCLMSLAAYLLIAVLSCVVYVYPALMLFLYLITFIYLCFTFLSLSLWKK